MIGDRINRNTPEIGRKLYQLLSVHNPDEWDFVECEHGVREFHFWFAEDDDPTVVRVSPQGKVFRDSSAGEAA